MPDRSNGEKGSPGVFTGEGEQPYFFAKPTSAPLHQETTTFYKVIYIMRNNYCVIPSNLF